MGLRQSKEGFRAYILETAAGETYIEERKPRRTGFTMTRLSSAEGRVALANANTIDDFQNKLFLDEVNTKAREGLGYTPVDGPVLPSNIPGLHASIRVVWMNHSAEAGMPHTRAPDIVCMPLDYPAQRLVETLKHESVHIDQKQRPEAWLRWCISVGWTLIREEEIPERWVRRCRLNPDTMAYRFWAYNNRYVPLPMYERTDKPKMHETHIYWWDKVTGHLLKETPSDLKLFLQGVLNPEHPFEIAAYKDIHVE